MQSIREQGSNLTPSARQWRFGARSPVKGAASVLNRSANRSANKGKIGNIFASLLFCLSIALPLSPAAQAQSDAVVPAAVSSVNINEAAPAELAAGLTGVGLARAEAIVRYREQFGPFETIDELSEVSGIGAATVERNRSSIVLN